MDHHERASIKQTANKVTICRSGYHPDNTHKTEESRMAIVSIIRPELTAEERAKRMEAIKQAAVKLIVATERSKARKEIKI